MVIFENMPLSDSLYTTGELTGEKNLRIGRLSAEQHTSYDLSVTVFTEEDIRIIFSYNERRYSSTQMSRLAGHFRNLLGQLIREGDVVVDSLRLLTAEEEETILKHAHGPVVFRKDVSLITLLQESSARKAENVCVRYGKRELTYAEVDKRSSLMAGFLQQQMDVQQGDTVGVLMNCSEQLIVTLLAIMKCGAGFVPLETASPQERINYMLKVADCKCFIGKVGWETAIKSWEYDEDIFSPASPAMKKTTVCGDDLLYVIFTSGSTGVPMGVKINNRSAVNYSQWANERYFEGRDHINSSIFAPIVLDHTLAILFTTLLRGDTLVIFNDSAPVQDTLSILFNPDSDIQAVKLLPSQINFLEQMDLGKTAVHTVIATGEELHPSQVAFLRKLNPAVRIFNEYGSSEVTIGCSAKEITTTATPFTVGRPISNTSLFVLDKSLHVQPVNALGELCVAGDSLSAGYLDEPATANSFHVLNSIGRKMIYRTGDAAAWTEDYEVILSRRTDDQIKINGYRIEPQEISTHICRMEEVKEALVTTVTINEEIQLAVYYETEIGKETGAHEIIAFLRSFLPDYMIPRHYVKMDALPLNINRKTEKNQLPIPLSQPKVIISPANKVEEELLRIWAHILAWKPEEISMTDDLFLLGANSLRVVDFVLKVQDVMEKPVSISLIFDNRTIRQQAALIGNMQTIKAEQIGKTEKKPFYKQAAAQKRLFILNELDKESLSYNISAGFNITGKLEVKEVEAAFRQLIARHDILRTSFFVQEGTPVQQVQDNCSFNMEYYEAGATDFESIKKQFFRPFILDQPPLIRAMLIKEEDSSYKFVVDMHHIVCDGISINVLVDDFIKAYRQEQLIATDLSYSDYAEWSMKRADMDEYKEHAAFWKQQFLNYSIQSGLPADFKRQAVRGSEGRLCHYELTRRETDYLRRLSKKMDVSIYTLLLTCISVLITQLSNEEEVVIGTSVSGRNNPALERMIGMFVNTMAMRIQVNPDKPFPDLLKEVKELVIKALEHQDYAFEDVLSDLGMQFDPSRNPLFDVMFVLQEDWEPRFGIPGVVLEPFQIDKGVAKFDLTIECVDKGTTLHFNLEYATDVFKKTSIDRLFDAFRKLIRELEENAGSNCSQLDCLPVQQREKILYDFNNTFSEYSSAATIHQLVERQVLLSGDRTAVITAEEAVSYAALNSTANRLAALLAEVGLLTGMPVGILLERSVAMVYSVLGVLKAGGVYVPLEVQQPDARINSMMQSIGMGMIIADVSHLHRLEQILHVGGNAVRTVICTGALKDCPSALVNAFAERGIRLMTMENIQAQKDVNVERAVGPDDFAYIIHTSGSSGIPKGVLVRHQPVVNTLEWVNKTYGIGSSDKLLFLTSLGFDLSVYDIFGMLMAGGSIRLAKQEDIMDARKLLDIVFNENITFWDSAPAALQQVLPLLREAPYRDMRGVLRRVFLSGDWVPLSVREELLPNFKEVKVTALGGATEAAIWSNFFDITEIDPNWRSIPYGKPIQNARYYVLDKHLKCCPIGTPGDLYIGGKCLATGYVNDVVLTRTKFLQNPFEKNTVFYKTGDRARWFEDGNLEFLGRTDSQVKLRGYRIELGEIETRLKKYKGIGDAVAIVRDMGSSQKICAYYTASEEINSHLLRDYLAIELPQYMIPSYFICISQIPVTINGKLDKKALPEVRLEAEDHLIAPADELERLLVEICGNIIGMAPADIAMNMNFAQLGGSSIDAMKLVSVIEKQFSVRLRLMDILRMNNISEIAVLIRSVQMLKNTAPVSAHQETAVII